MMAVAKKRKRPSKPAQPLTARAFEGFAVEVRQQFAEVRDQFTEVREQFTEVSEQFTAVREQFKALDTRIVDLRDHMDQRFEQVDRRFDGIEQDIGRLQDASREHGRQLRLIQQNKVDREEVEVIVERVLARDRRR